jgi:hypothetical protein
MIGRGYFQVIDEIFQKGPRSTALSNFILSLDDIPVCRRRIRSATTDSNQDESILTKAHVADCIES